MKKHSKGPSINILFTNQPITKGRAFQITKNQKIDNGMMTTKQIKKNTEILKSQKLGHGHSKKN